MLRTTLIRRLGRVRDFSRSKRDVSLINHIKVQKEYEVRALHDRENGEIMGHSLFEELQAHSALPSLHLPQRFDVHLYLGRRPEVNGP